MTKVKKSGTRRLLTLILSAALLLGIVPAYAVSFNDTIGHWAQYDIDRWSDTQIIEGSNGLFRPDDPITRGEMATLFTRMMNYHTAARNTFSDLPDAWYTDPILRCVDAGIMQGDGSTVRPTAYITRQEAATMICRALNIEGVSGRTSFSDDWDIADWARPYIRALNDRRLIDGVGGGNFAPNANINRASVVRLLDNATGRVYNRAGTYTGNFGNSVVISAAGVVLSDTTIEGDLIIAEGVRDGSVELRNVIVRGHIFVKGGGSNTIDLYDCTINGITVMRRDGVPRIRLHGRSSVTTTNLRYGATLEETSGLTGSGFGDVEISATSDNSTIRADLYGDFGNLTQNCRDADLRITGSVQDMYIHANTRITGELRYRNAYVDTSYGCTINGERISSSGIPNRLTSVTITMPGGTDVARVGDTLTAATVVSGSLSLNYRWFWASSNLPTDSSNWNRISSATYKTYDVSSEMVGRYIMVEVSANYDGYDHSVRAKTYDPVANETGGKSTITVENYTNTNSTRNESSVRFVFTRPVSLGVDGSYAELPDKYDFKYSDSYWFAVRVNNGTISEDDSLIASAIYSRTDNSITVTLSGDAAIPANRVTVKLNRTIYDVNGSEHRPANSPTAVRIASVSMWQNGGANGNASLDTTPPVASAATAGNSSSSVKLVFNEPLGYYINNVYRPVPNSYNFRNLAGVSGLFAVSFGGAPQLGDGSVLAALYSTVDNSITVSLDENLSPDLELTIAPLINFYDVYGNPLTPAKAGVFYRKQRETRWYRADSQAEADASAAGGMLIGYPAFVSGHNPPRVGETVRVGPGSLNIETGLTYTWYRVSTSSAPDKELGTGTSYTPVKEDINHDLKVTVKSTDDKFTGTHSITTASVVTRLESNITAATETINVNYSEAIDLTKISGLFRVTSDGKRVYEIDPSYIGAHLTPEGILRVPGPGEYEITLRTEQSDTYSKHDPVAATIRITRNAPRSIVATAVFDDASKEAGSIKFSAYEMKSDASVLFVKSTSVSNSTSQGETWGEGEYFSGVGYKLVNGNTSSNTFTGSFVGTGTGSRAFYLVETDSAYNVIRTGVLKVTDAETVAVLVIDNRASASDSDIEISSFKIDDEAPVTSFTSYEIADNYYRIYMPRSNKKITLTVATAGAKEYSVNLSFNGSDYSQVITPTRSNFGLK